MDHQSEADQESGESSVREDSAARLARAERVWEFNASAFHLFLNPPLRMVFVVMCFVVALCCFLLGGLLAAAVVLAIGCFTGAFWLTRSLAASRSIYLVAIDGAAMACGKGDSICWFPIRSVVRVSPGWCGFKILHLESGHQQILPEEIYRSEDFQNLCIDHLRAKEGKIM